MSLTPLTPEISERFDNDHLVPDDHGSCKGQREWDRWMSGSRATRLEARLQKWRDGKLRRMINGVTAGSVGWFILSSVITNAIVTVSLARLVSGKPVPEWKVQPTTGDGRP